jgi:RNA polymerase sigma factor (sigma-70 family)
MDALPAPNDARLAALLARWQADGDVDALDELLRAEVDGLARRLRGRAGDALSASTSASDLVQEAVLRWLRLDDAPRFDDVRGLRGYLWTAAWRLLVNRVGRPGAALRLTPDESMSLSGVFSATGGLGALAAEEQRTALEVVVNLLRPEDRECLGLVYFQGLPIDAAARRAGVSRGAFDMRLMRARQRLAERLVDWADVVG